ASAQDRKTADKRLKNSMLVVSRAPDSRRLYAKMRSKWALSGHLKSLTTLGFRAWKRKSREGALAQPDTAFKILSDNRQAGHNYFLMERFEAGLVLTGTEVKAAKD